jgi:hypothetical protein
MGKIADLSGRQKRPLHEKALTPALTWFQKRILLPNMESLGRKLRTSLRPEASGDHKSTISF